MTDKNNKVVVLEDSIQDRVRKKNERMKKRKEVVKTLMRDFSVIEKFRDLANKDYNELFGVLHAEKWRVHHAAIMHNLDVSKRRGNGLNRTMRFSSSNPAYRTLFRICMLIWSRGDYVETHEVYSLAEDHGYHKSSVNSFLGECVKEKILHRESKGVYSVPEEVADDHWENLLTLILSPSTYEFVNTYSRIYEMLTFVTDKENRKYRKGDKALYTKILNEFSDD